MGELSDIVLHPRTAAAIGETIARPTQALMITGAAGSGKGSTSKYLISRLLSTPRDKLENHPYLRVITPIDNKAIPIEAVRELQHFLSLRIPGASDATVARAVIIEDAQLLTAEAQNALLKTLEEPPADTVILLTATSTESVLPTIQSRVRQLAVLPPAFDDLLSYFQKKGYSLPNIEKALLVSGELPGLTSALLDESSEHPLVIATTHARGILQSKTYERLLLVDGLSKQKQQCLDILYVLTQMSRMALMRTTDATAARRWQQILKASYQATERLRSNTQPKLVLTNLMLEL